MCGLSEDKRLFSLDFLKIYLTLIFPEHWNVLFFGLNVITTFVPVRYVFHSLFEMSKLFGLI